MTGGVIQRVLTIPFDGALWTAIARRAGLGFAALVVVVRQSGRESRTEVDASLDARRRVGPVDRREMVAGREGIVEIEFRASNDQGDHVSGTAVISLPLRTGA